MKDSSASRHKAQVTHEDAVERLFVEHAADVLRWVIRLGGPYVHAEDVAQDVFATALKRYPSFRGDSSPRTWLFSITRNVVRNARRRAALRRFVGLGDEVPEPASDAPGADEALGARRRRRSVQTALETLSTKHREALVLVDMEGLTAREAGALLGVPEGTVSSRLHHGRKAFASALKRQGFRP